MQKLFCGKKMLIDHEKECNTNYRKSSDLKVEYIPNGIVHPLELSSVGKFENKEFGGVTDDKLNFISLSLTKRVSPPNFRLDLPDWFQGHNSNRDLMDIDYVEDEVIYLGALPKHYGHFI